MAFNRDNVPTTDVWTIGTAGGNGNGARLTTGGTWTNASSRSLKDRFVSLDSVTVLSKVKSLEIGGWHYKGLNEYHIGPFAEDFFGAFGTGTLDNPDNNKTVAALDVAGVALYASQQLIKQNETLFAENEKIRKENDDIKARLERLESLVRNESARERDVPSTKVAEAFVPTIISIAPDPARNYAVVTFELPAAAPVDVLVSSGTGERVLDVMTNTYMQAGRYEVEVNLQRVANGWYVCEVRAGAKSAQRLFRVIQ